MSSGDLTGLDDDGLADEFAADRLDDAQLVEAADPGGMLRQVASSAAQVRTAVRACSEADLSPVTAAGRPRAIVVAGMGGSAAVPSKEDIKKTAQKAKDTATDAAAKAKDAATSGAETAKAEVNKRVTRSTGSE